MTESMPWRCSRCPRRSPAGPAPMMAPWVRLFGDMTAFSSGMYGVGQDVLGYRGGGVGGRAAAVRRGLQNDHLHLRGGQAVGEARAQVHGELSVVAVRDHRNQGHAAPGSAVKYGPGPYLDPGVARHA